MNKELCITTDFMDELYLYEKPFTEQHMDEMMSYAASLGATRYEWIFDTMWNFYEEGNPLGYDILKVACDTAHKHGMRFDVIYKPFEGGLNPGHLMPPKSPYIEDAGLLEDDRGIMCVARDFIVKHPEMRLARREGDGEDPGGKLKEIRLISFNDNSNLDPKRISIWHSSYNGGFQKYDGTFEYSISKEWRNYYPYDDKESTIVSLTGFSFPEDVKFFVIKYNPIDNNGNFSNHYESLIELINEKDEVIPYSPSVDKPDYKKMYLRLKKLSDMGMTDYLQKPEILDILKDYDTFEKYCDGMLPFGLQWGIHTLDSDGDFAFYRGKPKYHTGALHPIYPEVRKHWLDEIQYCIDRNVDGVNIRLAAHGIMNEPWAYGFNKPVMERLDNKENLYEAAVVNGNAFDKFMDEAATLLHDNKRELGAHIHALHMRSTDRGARPSPIPRNFKWDWENWINNIVDYVEFRGTSFLKFHNVRELVDRVSCLAKEAGIPFIYQSARDPKVIHFSSPHHYLKQEMKWAHRHPDISCYNLYETAYFNRLDNKGDYEGSCDMQKLVKSIWQQ